MIKISGESWRGLNILKEQGESFDNVIQRLIKQEENKDGDMDKKSME